MAQRRTFWRGAHTVRRGRIGLAGVKRMLPLLTVFLQAAASHILYLALHLESGSFPRPLPPAKERAAFEALRAGGAGSATARDLLIRHNLRLVAHVAKKYYAASAGQDDLISIGTIGLIKAVDTFDPARASKFSSYASRCIENELRMELRRIRRQGQPLSLQEPLEGSAQLTLAEQKNDPRYQNVYFDRLLGTGNPSDYLRKAQPAAPAAASADPNGWQEIADDEGDLPF